MLSIGASTKVFLRPGPTDLRLGFEGFYHLVRISLSRILSSGHVFAFCNQSKTRPAAHVGWFRTLSPEALGEGPLYLG